MEQLLQGLIGKIQALLNRGITRTEFFTLAVPYTPDKGIPIGQGACKAVVLKVNALTRNDTNVFVTHMYYGDSKGQERELIGACGTAAAGDPITYNFGASEVIFCTDLSQVFVRHGLNGNILQLQVLVYK